MTNTFTPGTGAFTVELDKKLRIDRQIGSIDIYEDLFSPMITANMSMVDANDLLIVGNEKVLIEAQTPHDEESISLTLRLYKLSGRVRYKANMDIYTLHAASDVMMDDTDIALVTPYKNGTLSSYVKAIHESYLKKHARLVEVEDSDGIIDVIPPRVSPFTFMNYLASEARSLTNPASNYVFFQTRAGFSFVTLDSLAKKKARYTFKEVLHGSPLERGDRGKHISAFNYDASFDLLNDKMMGRTKTQVRAFNPLTKSVTLYNEQTTNAPQVEKLIATTSARTRPSFAAKEKQSLIDLNEKRASILIPGNPYVFAGDTVNIRLPAPAKDEFSGKYLVTAIRNTFTNTGNYATALELMKVKDDE